LREVLAGEVAAGRAMCARCGLPVAPGQHWDVGHVDGGGPNDYAGVEHRSCNRATSGRRLKAAALVHGAAFRSPHDGRPWSRQW
jgi:hypothetical protein